MPELPEVETVRRGLVPVLEGAQLVEVEVLDARLVGPAVPSAVEEALRGRTVARVERRGKYLLLRLDGGVTAVHHLRMTGSFGVREAADAGAEPAHVRLRYHTPGVVVWYRDPRRFGTLDVLADADADAHLAARLGPEPLGAAFTPGVLHSALRTRRAPIKAVLLDQRVVAGLGNIYVDEALHQAHVDPRTPAASLSPARVARLHDAIRDRLRAGIAAGGSTLRDYRGVRGDSGSMQDEFHVYGRAGLPCHTCGTTLRRATLGGRTSVWCPRCQRR